jgi:Beta-galactosidase
MSMVTFKAMLCWSRRTSVGILCTLGLFLAVPACLLAAEGSPLRTGLWVTEKTSEAAANVAAFESAIRANPHLSGICLTASWNEVEREAGHLDFSTVDKAVAALHRIGMKYEIAVKPGVDTPAYVYQQGAEGFETRVTNPHRATFGEAERIPIPWDPVYQRNFSRIIEELGKRYASDPLCVSVVLTCANFMSKEMHLPKQPEDRAKWQASGDYESKLLGVYKKYIDEWGKAFPRQELSIHLAKVADLPPSFNEHVIDYGLSKYPDRFTIQNCQLTGRREDAGTMSYDLVLKYGNRLHHGFQSLAGFAHGGERMGSIEMAALNVVHANGEYWELWHGDGMNPQVSAAVLSAWEEAKKLGYEEYKKKLIAEGRYQEQSGRPQRGGRHGRRNAGIL